MNPEWTRIATHIKNSNNTLLRTITYYWTEKYTWQCTVNWVDHDLEWTCGWSCQWQSSTFVSKIAKWKKDAQENEGVNRQEVRNYLIF